MAQGDVEIRVALRDEVTVPLKKVESGIIRFVGAVSAAIAAAKAIVFPVQQAASFEQAMLDVAKTTGFTGESFEKLGSDLVNLSRQIDVTAVDLANIAAIAGQLGLGDQGAEGIAQFTETTARFSSVLDVAVDTAAEGLAKISNIFSISLRDAEKIASAFNEVSNTSTASGQALLDVVRRLGNAGSTIDLAESIGLAATGVDFGLTLETIGTSFTKIFSNMLARADQFAEFMGTSTKEWSDLVQNDGIGALKAYAEQLGKVDSGTRAAFSRQLTGGGRIFSLVGKIVNDSANGFAVLNKNIDNGTDAFNEGTSAIEEYARVQDGLIKRLKVLGNSISAAAIESGSESLPFLKSLTQQLTNFFQDEKTLDAIDRFAKSIGESVKWVIDLAKAVGDLNINWANLTNFLTIFVSLKVVQVIAAMITHFAALGGKIAIMTSSWRALTGNIEAAIIAKKKLIASGGLDPSGSKAAKLTSADLAVTQFLFRPTSIYGQQKAQADAVLRLREKMFADMLTQKSKYVTAAQKLNTAEAAQVRQQVAYITELRARQQRILYGISASRNLSDADAIKRYNTTLAAQNAAMAKQQALLRTYTVNALTAQVATSRLGAAFRTTTLAVVGFGKKLIGALFSPWGIITLLVLDFLGVLGKAGEALSDFFSFLGFSSRESQESARAARLAARAERERTDAILASANAYKDLIEQGKTVRNVIAPLGDLQIGELVDQNSIESLGSIGDDVDKQYDNIRDSWAALGIAGDALNKKVSDLSSRYLENIGKLQEYGRELNEVIRLQENLTRFGGERSDAGNERIAELEEQRKKIQEQITALNRRNNLLREDIDNVVTEVNDLDRVNQGLRARDKALQDYIGTLKEEQRAIEQFYAASRSEVTARFAEPLEAIRVLELELAEATEKMEDFDKQKDDVVGDTKTPTKGAEQYRKWKGEVISLTAQLETNRGVVKEMAKDLSTLERYDFANVSRSILSAPDATSAAVRSAQFSDALGEVGAVSGRASEQYRKFLQALAASGPDVEKAVTAFERVRDSAQRVADEAQDAFDGVAKEIEKLTEPARDAKVAIDALFTDRTKMLAYNRDLEKINDNYDWAINRITRIKEREIDRLKAAGVYYKRVEFKERELTRSIELQERQRADAIKTREARLVSDDADAQLLKLRDLSADLVRLQEELQSAVGDDNDAAAATARRSIDRNVEAFKAAQDVLYELLERMSGDEFQVGEPYLERFLFGKKDVSQLQGEIDKLVGLQGSTLFDIRKFDSEEATKRAQEVTAVYDNVKQTLDDAVELAGQLGQEFGLNARAVTVLREEINGLTGGLAGLAGQVEEIPTLNLSVVDADVFEREFNTGLQGVFQGIANDPVFKLGAKEMADEIERQIRDGVLRAINVEPQSNTQLQQQLQQQSRIEGATIDTLRQQTTEATQQGTKTGIERGSQQANVDVNGDQIQREFRVKSSSGLSTGVVEGLERVESSLRQVKGGTVRFDTEGSVKLIREAVAEAPITGTINEFELDGTPTFSDRSKPQVEAEIIQYKTPDVPPEIPASLDGDESQLQSQVSQWNIKIPATLVPRTDGTAGSNTSAGQGFASGGHVRGAGSATSDSILSWLSNGEYVIKAKAVRKYGLGMFNMLNNMRVPTSKLGSQLAAMALTAGEGMDNLMRYATPNTKMGRPAFAEGGPVNSAFSSNAINNVVDAFNRTSPVDEIPSERIELTLDVQGQKYRVMGARDEVRGLVGALKSVNRSLRK